MRIGLLQLLLTQSVFGQELVEARSPSNVKQGLKNGL